MSTILKQAMLILIVTGSYSCSKKGCTDPTASNYDSNAHLDNGTCVYTTVEHTGTLILHMHTYISNHAIGNYNSILLTNEGRQMSLSLAQLYISDIQLVGLDDQVYNVGEKVFLKVFEEQAYPIENVPIGNYKQIKFKVGLNAELNTVSPGNSSDSTILNHPEMWFSNTAQPDGYVFLNVQGSIDTSTNLNGNLIPFEYKIGTNNNYTSVSLPEQNFTIFKDMEVYQHILIDYSKLLNGVQLNDSLNLKIHSISDNNSAIATSIVDNIPSIFNF